VAVILNVIETTSVNTSGVFGAWLTAVVSGGPGHPGDRLILYNTDNTILDWFFLNGTKAPPAAGLTSGQCTFGRPSAAGKYKVQFVHFYQPRANYQDTVLADGVTYYWQMDETSGVTAVDMKAGLNGTISGGVTLGTPHIFPGTHDTPVMTFNGVDGQIVTSAPITLPSGAVTFEAWIRQTKTIPTPTVRYHCIWTNRRSPGLSTTTDVFFVGTVESNGVLHAILAYGPNQYQGVTDIGDGQWHHIVVAVAAPQMVIFVDGKIDASLGTLARLPADPGGPPAIGRDLTNATVTQFNGALGKVAVYYSNLSHQKITEHAAYGFQTTVLAVETVTVHLSEPQVCLEMEFLGKNQGWTIVRDWYVNPGLVWHRGLPGIGILDLIADIGTLHFTLDNSEKNSVGKVGYYSPDHANKRYGFYLNIGVRVRIGQSKRFTGVISSIDPVPGKFGTRTVQVECTDWMGIADRTRIENLPVLVNKRGDEVFRTLLDSLPGSAHPDGVQADSSPDIYPYTLDRTRDEQTVLRDELYRLCTSGMARIYVLGDGTLVYENRGRRAAITSSVDTFTDSHGFTSSHGREAIVNRAQATIHPRLPSATDVVLYSMPQPMELVAGTPLTIMGPWSDPANPNTRVGAVSLVSPLVRGTDYVANSLANGTGTDLTASVVILAGLSGNATSFTVSLPQGGFLIKLQQRGKPLYDYGQAVLTWEDTTSIAQFGVASTQIDMPYTADPNLALEVAQFTVYNGAFPLTNVAGFSRIVDLKNPTELQRSIGRLISDRISIIDPVTGLSKPFFINAVDETISENRVTTQWMLTPGDATGYWLLEVDGFTELDITTRLGFGQILGHVDIVHQDIHGDQIHYDSIHIDTHSDNVHVDLTHVDFVTHTDVTDHHDQSTHVDDPGHSDSVAHTDYSDHVDVTTHDDVTHQDVPHTDGAHTDIAQVYWHTDIPHTDIAHYDVYYDSPHQDIAHQDSHDDWRDNVPGINFLDHIDCNPQYNGTGKWHLDCNSKPYGPPYGDPNPNGSFHNDQNHVDGHYDQSGLHYDQNDHVDYAHQDAHGDSHADYHADQRHVDEGYFDPHQDVPYQAAHGDTPHYDVPHYDTAQVYVPHTDVYPHSDSGAHHDQNIHTDTSNHSDAILHDDVTSHADNNVHSDTPHTDITHGDTPHQDIAHSDVPHQDTHQDFHGDSN
jgi:hypothetical protein